MTPPMMAIAINAAPMTRSYSIGGGPVVGKEGLEHGVLLKGDGLTKNVADEIPLGSIRGRKQLLRK